MLVPGWNNFMCCLMLFYSALKCVSQVANSTDETLKPAQQVSLFRDLRGDRNKKITEDNDDAKS